MHWFGFHISQYYLEVGRLCYHLVPQYFLGAGECPNFPVLHGPYKYVRMYVIILCRNHVLLTGCVIEHDTIHHRQIIFKHTSFELGTYLHVLKITCKTNIHKLQISPRLDNFPKT